MAHFLPCLLLTLEPSASHAFDSASYLRRWNWIYGVDDDANSSKVLDAFFEVRGPFEVLRTKKGKWKHKHVRASGRKTEVEREKPYYDVDEFLRSGEFFDWALFGAACLLYWWARDSHCCSHPNVVLSLLLWVLLGCAFNVAMFVRWGDDIGVLWLDGYIMELIFSLENAVFFLALAELFAAPILAMRRILVLLVLFQNLFDLVLYMGLATTLDSLSVLPYVVGAWLLFAGIHSMGESLHSLHELPSIFSDRSSGRGEEAPLVKSELESLRGARFSDRKEACRATMHSFPVRVFRCVCGERFADDYDSEDPTLFFVVHPATQKCQLTVLFLLAVKTCLLDFLLEVDVTLTKIENLQDPYVCFTSSALASFAMPELVLVTWKLTRRCPLVTVGISIIIILFGAEMLMKPWIEIGPLDECALMVSVLFMFVLASEIGAYCVRAQ